MGKYRGSKKSKRNLKKNSKRKSQRKTPKRKIVIGKIYADWCGHCKILKPEWNKMKTMIKNNTGRSLKNVEFDIHELGENDHTRENNIEINTLIDDFNKKQFPNGENRVEYDGFPTVFKIFKKRIDYYNGQKNADDLYNWATKN